VAFWTGIVTYSDTNEITLTTVEEVSGTFGAGTKEIMSGALASTATFREDISGAIVTGGTSTAYTVATYREYDTLARLNGNIIAFTPHTTNTGSVTLSADGLTAKPLRSAPSAELFAGVLIEGTPYLALYNHSDQVFYLHGFFGNPYNVPLASGIDYWALTAPNSAFAFPIGQDLSRTTYAALFALIGTTYGSSSGSTFKLPDKIGRVSAMKSPGGANRLTTAGSGVDSATLGAAGGGETSTLLTTNLPPYTPSGGVISTFSSTNVVVSFGQTPTGVNVGSAISVYSSGNYITANGTVSSTFAGNSQGGTSTPVRTVPPTIVCNYIMRIL
jgi:microcystin-dependent protein